MAALDVDKAFDRVHHSVLFDSLLNAKVDADVISALRRMYADMRHTLLQQQEARAETSK